MKKANILKAVHAWISHKPLLCLATAPVLREVVERRALSHRRAQSRASPPRWPQLRGVCGACAHVAVRAPFLLLPVAGMQVAARGVCGTSLRPRAPLRSRCAVLVCDPVLFHSDAVRHPEAVQDEPLFSNQGT